MEMEHRYMPHWFLWIVGLVRPRVNPVRRGVPCQLEYLDNPFPNSLALECLFDWHTFNVRSLSAVQSADYVPQFLDIAHDAASTKSPTLQKLCSTPAAIAGVQRSVPWRFTR